MYFNLNSNFPVEKNWTWACDQLKSSNLSAENSKEILNYDGSTLSRQYGHVILFSGYPVLTAVKIIDHNMYVQYQVASHTSQIDSVPFHHIVWPLVWTDRQMYGHITTKKISRRDR